METKFTPWRKAYITRGHELKGDGCVLCDLGRQQPNAAHLVLFRGEYCYVVMNLFPYNTGHLMVVPYNHTADLPGLAAVTAVELFELTRRCVAILGAELRPQGANLGMNLGEVAGAGIAEHLHMHIVPRWSGDTNFMPLIGGTKLIPETLEETYQRLLPHFQAA